MSDSLLSTTLTAIATRIGDELPAAYPMVCSEVQIAGDAADHDLPADAKVVRWEIGDDGGYLVVALTPDAADMLVDGADSLVAALTERVELTIVDMAPLFNGIPPMLGEGEEVPALTALAEGPGDAVTVSLDDGGLHRATVGMRLIVSDALMEAPERDDEIPLDDAIPLLAPDVPAAGAPIKLMDGAAADQPVSATGDAAAAAGIVGSRQGAAGRQASRPQMAMPVGQAHPADFASFDQVASLPGATHSMSLLGDVEMGVTAELGRTALTVREILGLTPGAIIELDRAAGSPVDVVVNGTLIARGEVVVIDEEFGIRITEILGMAAEANPFPVAQ